MTSSPRTCCWPRTTASRVRLLDFGLAQFDEAETLTAVGDVPGTLAYISPERLRGEEACPASDIWGVGILLWEALAGKHPFWGVPLQQMAGNDRNGGAAAPGGAPRPPEAAPQRNRPCAGKRPEEAASGGRARQGAAQRARRRGAASSESSRRCDPRLRSPNERLPAAAAFAAALAGAMMLPFFPAFWAPAFALVAGALTSARPGPASRSPSPHRFCRSGTSHSDSRCVYGAIAFGWLLLSWRTRVRARVPGGPAARPSRADRARAACRSAGQGARPPWRPGAGGGRCRRARRRPPRKRPPVRPGRSGKLDVAGNESAVDAAIAIARAVRSASSWAASPSPPSPSPFRMPGRHGGSQAWARAPLQLRCSPCQPLPRYRSSLPSGSPASVSVFEPSIRVARRG